MNITEAASQLVAEAMQALEQVADLAVLEKWRTDHLGKKSALHGLLRQLGELPAASRPQAGIAIHAARKQLEASLADRRQRLERAKLERQLAAAPTDLSLPGRQRGQGSLHPVSLTLECIETLFDHLGFMVADGPEIEDDYHNFEALNIPPHHPARAMHDTFYLHGTSRLLRTHTSPVQVRVMESMPPPLRIICPGRVYRRDFDPTHTPVFHQVEGLWIDRQISFAHLRGLVEDFLHALLGEDFEIRFRSSYFPFTEPSAEVDIRYLQSDRGAGNWLEVMGCGMVNPKVLEISGIDPQHWQGLAFGLGVERLAMLRHGIDDIRLLFENDLRFLEQFPLHGVLQ